MSLESLADDIASLTKKHKLYSSRTREALDGVQRILESAEASTSASEALQAIKAGDFAGTLTEAAHALYNSASKVGKRIDASVNPDIGEACLGVPWDDQEVQSILLEDLYRDGHFSLGDLFARECQLPHWASIRQPFAEIHAILEALSHKDVGPALHWARAHRDRLPHDRQLEFYLHRLVFIQRLQSEGASAGDCVSYGRTHFAPFAARYMEEMQHLMGLVAYLGRFDLVPPSRRYLLGEGLWETTREEVMRQACLLRGWALRSPLKVVATAGAAVLPRLLKVAALGGKTGATAGVGVGSPPGQGGGDGPGYPVQVPVELELPREFYFHSIFACPVSKDQSTPSNPPSMLPCGHVLNQTSVQEIAAREKKIVFKCPYCPRECRLSECRTLTFPRVDHEARNRFLEKHPGLLDLHRTADHHPNH